MASKQKTHLRVTRRDGIKQALCAVTSRNTLHAGIAVTLQQFQAMTVEDRCKHCERLLAEKFPNR